MEDFLSGPSVSGLGSVRGAWGSWSTGAGTSFAPTDTAITRPGRCRMS